MIDVALLLWTLFGWLVMITIYRGRPEMKRIVRDMATGIATDFVRVAAPSFVPEGLTRLAVTGLAVLGLFILTTLLAFVWPVCLYVAARRQRKYGEEEGPTERVKRTVSKAQVKQLEQQVQERGKGVVGGELFTELRRKASVFVQEGKRAGKVPTVDEVLVNYDASTEFAAFCEKIGVTRDRLAKMCLDVGAVKGGKKGGKEGKGKA